MRTMQATPDHHAGPVPRPGAWLMLALVALLLGAALYVWARPQGAALLPRAWHQPIGGWPSNPLSAALPSFLHALAMPLLSAAVLQPRRAATSRALCAAWCVLELVFEAMQQRAIGAAVLALLPTQPPWSERWALLAAYVRRGTFDPLDVAASVLGCIAAAAVLTHGTPTPNPEASHG